MDKKKLLNLKITSAKALGFINAISNLSKEERRRTPSLEYGEDYNQLLKVVISNFPELKEFMPPGMSLYVRDSKKYCHLSYGEIYTFCEQIYQMVTAIYEIEVHS